MPAIACNAGFLWIWQQQGFVAFLLTAFNAFATHSALGVAAGSAKSFSQAGFAGAAPSFALGLFDKLLWFGRDVLAVGLLG